ncbi:MAG: hypothetical protein AAGF26_15450 [Cyanobacteria bacterium P01_G01_bin.49]
MDHSSSKDKIKVAVAIYMAVAIPIMFAVPLFVSGQLKLNINRWVISGVPMPIVIESLKDEIVRKAYFQGRKQLLHDRLGEMGIEEKIKDFYRSQASSERELDQRIHQIFYDNTGYVGEAYRVNSRGILIHKNRNSFSNFSY